MTIRDPESEPGVPELHESVYKRYCYAAPLKFHKFYMMKPLKKYTWNAEDGSMHQYVYCRFCAETFESVIRIEKDPQGRFKTIREMAKVNTVSKE